MPRPATTAPGPQPLAAVNTLDREAFVALLGGVYEDSPWVAAAAWAKRPFPSVAALEAAMAAVVANAGAGARLALIRAHPDLVGKAALTGGLGQSSTTEQAAAGLAPDRLAPDEIARFAAYNAAYWERFDFPFVICAREHKKEAILAAFPARLAHDRDTELATALAETRKIAHYRLIALVTDDAAP